MPSWFHFRTPPPQPEDPAVAVVEQLLDAVSREAGPLPVRDGKVVAERALAICACVCIDDAPKWLICDAPDGGFMWRRVPDKEEFLGHVDVSRTAGGHADPAEVLRWLQGAVPTPWDGGGYGSGDPGVLDALRGRVVPR